MSDTYSIIYSPKSIDDLKGIYSYIAFKLNAPDTAEHQANRIRTTIRSLDIMPSRNPIVDWEPWKSMNTHKVPVDNYIVYYTIDNNDFIVTIVRIFYSGRNLKNIMK